MTAQTAAHFDIHPDNQLGPCRHLENFASLLRQITESAFHEASHAA